MASSLNNLASLLHNQGEYAAARPLLERALAIRKRALEPDHPDVALSLNNLALLLDNQGEYAAARPLYERALAIWERALGPDHPDVALSLNNLAGLLDNQGEYAAARPLMERALAIDERALGPDHPDVGTDLNNLAALLNNQGEYAAARPLLERALSILTTKLARIIPPPAPCAIIWPRWGNNRVGGAWHGAADLGRGRCFGPVPGTRPNFPSSPHHRFLLFPPVHLCSNKKRTTLRPPFILTYLVCASCP